MSTYLDLDDVCGGHPMAQKELDDLRAELEAVKAERDALRTGDTCARACEGQAYRIEYRRLSAELDKANAFISTIRTLEPAAHMFPDDLERF